MRVPWQKALFEEIRESFLQRFGDELHFTFGPAARVSKVPVSQAVQARFLKRWHRCKCRSRMDSMCLAFHGTSERNFNSIFKRGLLLPGKGYGRTPIANGNAHGQGIYTAREGAAWLSNRFCDSKSMLVCGIIDASDCAEDSDVDEDADVMLRIGRLPKRPSACLRLGFGQVPLLKSKSLVQAQSKAKVIGRHAVIKESSEVRHIGDAIVVFNPSCVVPLFRVDNISGAFYQREWIAKTNTSEEKPTLDLDGENASEITSGSSSLYGCTPSATRHEIILRRNVERRSRQRGRCQDRDTKLRVLHS